jgi:hypothetical protein
MHKGRLLGTSFSVFHRGGSRTKFVVEICLQKIFCFSISPIFPFSPVELREGSPLPFAGFGDDTTRRQFDIKSNNG